MVNKIWYIQHNDINVLVISTKPNTLKCTNVESALTFYTMKVILLNDHTLDRRLHHSSVALSMMRCSKPWQPYHNVGQFRRLLHHPARKRSGSILKMLNSFLFQIRTSFVKSEFYSNFVIGLLLIILLNDCPLSISAGKILKKMSK